MIHFHARVDDNVTSAGKWILEHNPHLSLLGKKDKRFERVFRSGAVTCMLELFRFFKHGSGRAQESSVGAEVNSVIRI